MIVLTALMETVGGNVLAAYAHPFVQPLPIADQWYLLLLPLSAAIALVYKTIKCEHVKQVPREAGAVFVYILLGMAGAAALLAGVVRLLERS